MVYNQKFWKFVTNCLGYDVKIPGQNQLAINRLTGQNQLAVNRLTINFQIDRHSVKNSRGWIKSLQMNMLLSSGKFFRFFL